MERGLREQVLRNGMAVSRPPSCRARRGRRPGQGLAEPASCGHQAFLVIKISNFTVPAMAPTCPGREGKDCLRWAQPQAPGRRVLP